MQQIILTGNNHITLLTLSQYISHAFLHWWYIVALRGKMKVDALGNEDWAREACCGKNTTIEQLSSSEERTQNTEHPSKEH